MNMGILTERFPDDFMWGADLPGHRIEGGNFNSDWWHWEQRPRRISDQSTSKIAADHWSQFERDLDLARDFGLNTLPVTVEWSRIQPEPDTFDTDALAHYTRVFQGIRSRGMEPICILNHVSLPEWFAEDYGWAHPDAPGLFSAYVEAACEAFHDSVKWWIPIAEPMHWVTMVHIERLWPSTSDSLTSGHRALQHMARAHTDAYRIIHKRQPEARVGASIRARHFIPYDPWSAWDARMVLRETKRCNRRFLDALTTGNWPFLMSNDESLKNTLDFIGCAYYGSEILRFNPKKFRGTFAETVDDTGQPASGLLTQPYPDGLGSILDDLNRYNLPILITGNGLSHAGDSTRCQYLLDHIAVIRHALERNIPVRGYTWHSLLDGFEWTEGLTKRYGLMHVDHKKHTRTPNQIAFLYKELCETGNVRPGTVSRFCPDWTGLQPDTDPESTA
jgi:beta-glucosidase